MLIFFRNPTARSKCVENVLYVRTHDNRIFHHENDGNGRKWKVEKSKTMRYCVIHYCVVQSKCSYIILTLQTNRRLHTLLMTRQMGMLRRKRKLEFQLGDIKIWENNGVLKILKSKTSVGSASKEKKEAAVGHVALDGYVLASETYPWTAPDGVKDSKSASVNNLELASERC